MAIANILGIEADFAGTLDSLPPPQETLLAMKKPPIAPVPSKKPGLPPPSSRANQSSSDDKILSSPSMPSLVAHGDLSVQTEPIVNEYVSLAINGLQLMRVRLPDRIPGTTSKGTMHVLPNTLKARAPNMMAPDSRFTSVNLFVSAVNVCLPKDCTIQSFARFTGEGHQYDIQFKEIINRMDSEIVTEPIGFVPTHVTLHLKFHANCVVRDEEQQVLETLREIIADEKINPRGGSITSALANDILKEKLPELYDMVIKGKHGNLENFLNDHQDVFTLFTFSNKAIKKKTVSPEPRIVLKAGQRELCTNLPMPPAEVRLHQHLQEILGNKDMDKRDLLDYLSNDMTFATFLSPTLSILMRFLSRHKDRFVWSMDPDKPTVVGLQGRQHDSECLGIQADLDKQLAIPANKKWAGKGEKPEDERSQRDVHEGKGAKGERGKKGQKGMNRGRGVKDAEAWGVGVGVAGGVKGFNNREFPQNNVNLNANSFAILNGNPQGVQMINGQMAQYQIPQQDQFQSIVMPQQSYIYEGQNKQQEEMPIMELLNNDMDQIYRNQQDLISTPDGNFLFVENGQDRPTNDAQTVYLHEVRFVNGNAGQVSPGQQPLLMPGSNPLFSSGFQLPDQGNLAPSALPFSSSMPTLAQGGGVGT